LNTVTLTDLDWCSAAAADAVVEGLSITALQAARDVSTNPETFFHAVQGAVLLNDIITKREKGNHFA
jgi:hypothetical protein